MITKHTTPLAFAAVLLFTVTGPASAYIAGDGKGKPEADCFIGLEGYTESDQSPFGKKGRPAIQCADGADCDLDGEVNGSCLFAVGITINKPGVDGCTPAALRKLKARANTKGTKIDFSTSVQLPIDDSSASSALLDFPVLVKKPTSNRPRPGKGKVKVVAKKSEKPRLTDKDVFQFVCNPPEVDPECPNNPAGGPRQLTMIVNGDGADLDNGTSGRSHNFPVPIGTTLNYCLTGCDTSTNPICQAEGSTGRDTPNSATFGPPLPLFSAGVPVCVINEFKESTIRGTANVQTGEFSAETASGPTPVVLNSRVFQCSSNQVCPRCNGGRCQGGARNGQACRIDGTVVVNNPPAVTNDLYNLSNDCPPGGSSCARLGTIEVVLDLTTGTSMKEADAAGDFPCPGQPQHDECGGSSECTDDCSPEGGNPSVDPKGGVSQMCCTDTARTPCFPTSPAAGSLPIIRTGEANPPTPVWPDPTYPKTGAGKLAATFCEASAASIAVDGTAGLPGPGALILPGDTEWIGNDPDQ